MNQYPKRLIEVDLPIKRISAHARREKSIRHGHISTLHIWWARRPLAACRAVICASLWFDPADEQCPESFRIAARDEMRKWGRDHRDLMSAESFSRFEAANKDGKKYEDNTNLRSLLLDFIADFANWDNSTNDAYLDASQAITEASHLGNGGESGTRPLVVDPFAGGGSIPLEALRVGADAFASDLNPVAVLLNKVVLEYIPRFGQQLADEVQKWGMWIKEKAQAELGEFYPTDADGSIPIAYLWARTITCEGPGCGAEVPLLRSLWLAKKGSRSVALKFIPNSEQKRVDFEIVRNPKNVAEGTVRRGSTTCPLCGYTTPVASVRLQLKTRKGGARDARLYAVVTTRTTEQGRFYRLPTVADIAASRAAAEELRRRANSWNDEYSIVPDEIIPLMSGVFNAPIYGHDTWGSLFSDRQSLALVCLASLVREAGKKIADQHKEGLADAVQSCLSLALDRMADKNASLTVWNTVGEKIEHVFGRQALPMTWDFPEVAIFSTSTGNWMSHVDLVSEACGAGLVPTTHGTVERASATAHPLPDDSADALITDPPYYNAVPYADLSDFFYVWLKRTLPSSLRNNFGTELSPKADELCQMSGWDPVRYPEKDGPWYEKNMGRAMGEFRRILAPSGIGIVVFAHKSTAGWETQLQAMIDAGWTITGSWPIDTERPGRLRAQNSAALASSIHLVCRPRENADGSLRTTDIGDWRDILRELPIRIHEWMPRLGTEGVVGADAIFACLGPALEIFSRYSSVEKPSGEAVKLREFLEYIWAAVAKEALNMIFEGADATGFEEDARLTAMWLWTLFAGAAPGENSDVVDEAADSDEQGLSGKVAKSAGYILEYDAARKIAQGLGAHLEDLTSIIEVKGDNARLLPVSERARDLFGYVDSSATEKKRKTKAQKKLFEEMEEFDYESTTGIGGAPEAGATTLDRIHQAMLLFGAGRSEAVRRFLVDDGVGNDERFWRLANALSALYPSGTDEKRWVDGALARKKGLGF
jgi:putative DNA methylase